jgi:hypothetical protein
MHLTLLGAIVSHPYRQNYLFWSQLFPLVQSQLQSSVTIAMHNVPFFPCLTRICSKYGGRRFVRNTGIHLQHYTA